MAYKGNWEWQHAGHRLRMWQRDEPKGLEIQVRNMNEDIVSSGSYYVVGSLDELNHLIRALREAGAIIWEDQSDKS